MTKRDGLYVSQKASVILVVEPFKSKSSSSGLGLRGRGGLGEKGVSSNKRQPWQELGATRLGWPEVEFGPSASPRAGDVIAGVNLALQ
ncbi:unnamed protein product [Prunus armeniaca]